MTLEEKRAKNRIYQKNWIAQNTEKSKENNRKSVEKWGRANKEKSKLDWQLNKPRIVNTYRKRKYNITSEQYDARLVDQHNCCKGCGKHNDELTRGLFIDHCHITNKVRGLLCHNCNIVLGLVNDNTNILKQLIGYLTNESTL